MAQGSPPKTAAQIREERLKAALKANMTRRKAQARARNAQQTSKGQGDTGKGAQTPQQES